MRFMVRLANPRCSPRTSESAFVALKSLMKAVDLPAVVRRGPLRNLEGEAPAKGVRIVRDVGLDQRCGDKWTRELAAA